jgi:tetratricopeptide (TPR) repeat protein
MVGGLIGYYDLSDWWLNELSEKDRAKILKAYSPAGSTSNSNYLVAGTILSHSSETAIGLLTLITSFLSQTATHRKLAIRVLNKAINIGETLIENMISDDTLLELHFAYMWLIKINYKDRDSRKIALADAISACEKQIAIATYAASAFRSQPWCKSLPHHTGYEQLAIIREKEGNYEEAIALSQAASIAGWEGTWESRILRCTKKLHKLQ